MDKKILLSSLAVLSFTAVGIGTVSFIRDNANVSFIKKNDPSTTYSIILDKDNQLKNDGEGNFYSLTHELNNRIFFDTDGVVEQKPDNGWMSLTDGGTFHNPTVFNTNKIKGIKSIVINSNYNNLKLHYGNEVDGEITYSNYIEYHTTSISQSFTVGYEPSYIMIEAYTGSGPNLLEDVTITYSCSESAYTPTENLTYEVIDDTLDPEDWTYRITGFSENNCKFIRDLVIPSTINGKPVREIGDDAFNYMSKGWAMESITIPDSVTYIGERAFAYTVSVKKINMPSSGITWGADAFLYCGSMDTIDIAVDQTEIDLDAYKASPVLTAINVAPGNPKYYSVDGMLFAYDYTDDVVSNRNTLLYCPCGITGTVTIPNDYNSNNITYIAKDAFRRSKASTIHIGDNIDKISEDFRSAESLTSFTETNNSTYSIVNNMLCEGNVAIAYPRGRSDATITIPSTIAKVNDHVFDGINSFDTVTFMGNTEIGVQAFANMANLETATLTSVTIINSGAFKNDTSLEYVYLNTTLKALPEEAFMGCTSLESISLPNGFTTLGAKAFKDCTSLSSSPIPDSSALTSIGEEAFMNCTALQVDLVIPNSVTSIGKAAFRHSGVTDFNMSFLMSSIPEEMFYDCDQLTFITIPNFVKEVGKRAFYDCDSIYRIDIQDGVETIYQEAFKDCHVNYQFIPTSVTTIKASAFYFYSVIRIYTPYNFEKYASIGDNGLPSTWSEYLGGPSYNNVEGIVIINGKVSRSDFMAERNAHGW